MHKHYHPPIAFADLGIQPPLLHALERVGFVQPTEVQQKVVPLVLAGRDVLGQARTGTGKTAAFGLPILQMIHPQDRLQALVLTPTRELAAQVAGELRRLGQDTGLHVVPIYGGQRIKHHLHLLGKKPHIVVGTPGRVLDLRRRGALDFSGIRFAVLDEVDRMLDIGFRDDIEALLTQITGEHQTVFVSATLLEEIRGLARRYMRDPVEVDVSRDHLTVEEVAQAYVTVDPWDKFSMLRLVLEREKPALAIVFCNTKHGVRRLARRLHGVGVDAREIHGDLVQEKRERVMDRFRRHKLQVLVATDLAARGIDVQGISHIINYDVPADPYGYVHRIGRTARMGMFGKAISFVTREQGKQLTEIERLINKEITPQYMEGFEPSPPPGEMVLAAPAAPAVSRYRAPVFGGQETGVAAGTSALPRRPKGLGAKFKPTRRRRM